MAPRLGFIARFSVITFSSHTPLAGGMAMAFIDDLFLFLSVRPSFLSLSQRPLSAL